MSAFVWIFWAGLTIVNATMWFASWRHVNAARDLLEQAAARCER